MEMLFLLFWGPLVGALLLTLLLGKWTRRRWPMLLPLGFLVIPLAGGVYGWKQCGFLRQLEVALWAMIGGAIFLGWLIGRALCGGKERNP